MWKQQRCRAAAGLIAVLKMNPHAQLRYVYLRAESSKQLNKKSLIGKHSYQVINR